jgi:hypothetical protein
MPNWKKIKQLSLDEIRVRASQKLAAFSERHAGSSLPRPERILRNFSGTDYFRRQRPFKFFQAFKDPEATRSVLKSRFAEETVIRKANDIQNGRFDLLGIKALDFGTPPDWHLEPRSGKKTPLVHWSKLDYLDAEVAGDKKIVWELNRHQYFMTLGRAYWLTGDEAYAETFTRHLSSWMDQNPPKLGINWASSLEVSFRAISWLWAFHFFKHALTPELLIRALQYLHVHGRHLETYLSTYFSPNTHLTGEALGLYYLGTVLPEFPDSARWRSLGADILIAQLPIHVRPDGVYFEQTSYYHRYTTDFYVHFLLLARMNDEVLSPVVEKSLIKLLDHLMYITRPDGLTPLFGDDDGGRLAMLSENRPNDFSSTLSTGAALLDRADYKFVARELSEETLWLLGPEGCDSFDSSDAFTPENESVAFEDGGYYVMRDGWTDKSNYLLFDCGPHGQANCGHAHADALSFEVSVKGETLLVDPGTYTYTGSQQERDWFRGSAAHNTLMLDGLSSSLGSGPFSWHTIAKCRTLNWISRPRFDYVSGTHDGYPASHVRSILFLKGDYWVICDRVKVAKNSDLALRFHAAEGAEVYQDRHGNPVLRGANVGLSVVVKGLKGEWKQEEGWVSDCYAKRERAPVLSYSAQLSPGESTLITVLAPDGVEVTELEAIGGVAVQVKARSHNDLLLIRTLERVETVTLGSDLEVTWARVTNDESEIPLELVGVNGSSVQYKGRDLLRFGEIVKYAEARWTGSDYEVDKDVRN